MSRRLVSWLGTLVGAGLLALVLLAAYKSYGPGSFDIRIDRFQTRWRPFTDARIWLFIGRGLLITASAALISTVLSLVLGLGLSLLRLGKHRHLSLKAAPMITPIAAAILQAVRSSPLFLLILYTFAAAPRLGLDLSPFVAGTFALTLYTSCVMAEIFRAGILSLDAGQFEAAASLGLRYRDALRFVVLPQALRRMAPAAVSQLVTLIKDTSLLNFITLIEVSRRLFIVQQQFFNPIESFIVAGAIYFVINLALSSWARRLEVEPAVAARLQKVGAEELAA